MLCVSIGAWATITITPDPNPHNNTWIGTEQISNFKVFTISGWDNPGDVAKLLNGDTSLSVNWNGKSLSDLTGAIIIHLGAGANTDLLNEDDLAALDLLTSAKYLDMDGSKLADGASINKIEIGSLVEGVALPNGLTKAQVNEAGSVLSEYNSFGSCMSQVYGTETNEVECFYVADDDGNATSVEFTGETFQSGSDYFGKENTTKDVFVTETNRRYVYENAYNNNEVIETSSDDIVDGYVTPSPLKVALNKSTKYYVTYEGTEYEIPEHGCRQGDDGKYYGNGYVYIQGIPPYGQTVDITGLEVRADVTYTIAKTGEVYDVDTYGLNADGTGSLPNTGDDPIKFQVKTEYTYSYEDTYGGTQSYTSYEVESTKNVPWVNNIPLVKGTKEVESSIADIAAYVKTAGSLYKSTLIVPVALSLQNVVISGNINNGDIAVNSEATDPNNSKNDADKFDNNGAIPAFYNNNPGRTIKSIDMGDCVIDDYKYLRVLDAFGSSLESIVFPKTVTRIPNYCCNSERNAVQNLANIVFPTDATSLTIGDYAFHGIALNSLLLPSSVTQVGDYAFATCPNLYDVEMEGLNATCHFGNNVFERCSALQHVTLSEKVENIGDYMFNQCGLLESIRIPNTCLTIGSSAFQFCYSIHEVTIPEGVELIKLNAFEGAGLTDLYIMASSIDKLPKIYAMSPTGAGPSTFTHQRTTGNNTIPRAHEGDLRGADYDEVMTWYQEEQSGAEGLGTGNCLTALHYPESLKPFFEAIDITEFSEQLGNLESIPLQTTQQGIKHYYTPNEYLNFADAQYKTTLQYIVENQMDPAFGSGAAATFVDGDDNTIPYQYLPQSYGVDPRKDGSGTKLFGPDKDGNYYPNQTSYLLRMVAGATGTQAGGVGGQEVASAWGWRQFPLASSIESIGEIPFEKKYDDTWYTMCFPWKMEDNQLFMAFNQKLEIVEFKGAEVFQDPEDEYNYNLVFHFDEVAKTYYMDDEDVEYTRVRDENRVDAAGHNLYIYTPKGGGASVSAPDPLPTDPKNAPEDVKEQYGKYLSIKNIMVLPGHPYMIHPSIGAAPGNKATVYINGVKKIVPGEGLYASYATLADVAESQKQEYTVTSKEAGSTAEAEPWLNPVTGKGGKYTFIGNINDEVNGDKGAQNMPTDKGPVYFLGVKDEHTYYPQFFKKPKGKGQGKWSQYTAIIVPDDDAIANVEGLDGMAVGSGSTAPAKGYDVVFGDWEIVDETTVVTAIEKAQAEAEETGKPAQITHMNVVYNIKGQVVRADSSSVEGLPKGLYIVNGKKYMVK